MYLSRVLLKPGQLDNAWQWHRALWTLFPGIERESGESSPFLFRVESVNLQQGAQVLMQSSIEPEHESDRAMLQAKKDLQRQLRVGQQLAFSLVANVTKTIRDQDNPERKLRVPLIVEEQQIAWLKRKFTESAEIDFPRLQIQPQPPVYFRKGRSPGKIVPTRFEGVLQVRSPDVLQHALESGIGPAKAFGCGLMLVRRI